MAGEIKTGQIVGEVDRVTGKVRPVVKAELGNNVWSVTLGRGYACGPQPGIQHVLGSQFFPDLLEVGKKEIENEEKMLAEKEAIGRRDGGSRRWNGFRLISRALRFRR